MILGKHQRNFNQILAQAFNLGIHNQWFIKEESVAGTFEKPSVSTAGNSQGDVNPSIDISGGTDNKLKMDVDGLGVVDVTMDETAKNSGALIATELETKANAALVAAGYDAGVRVAYVGAPATDYYLVSSLKAGSGGSVVITDGSSDNVADDLKLGTGNGGTETAGTEAGDDIAHLSGGLAYSQPIEASPHRTGNRTPVNIIKKKKVLTWTLGIFHNPIGDSNIIDAPIDLLWESLLGTRETATGEIVFKPGIPSKYFSVIQVGSALAQYANGMWTNQAVITLPGDGEAKIEFSGIGQETKLGGMAYVSADVLAPTSTLVVKSTLGGAKQFETGSYIMVIDKDDGKTIKSDRAGIEVTGSNTSTDTLSLGANVDDLEEDDLVVYWYPDSFEPSDDPQVGCEGEFTWNSEVNEMLSGVVTINNNHEDRNDIFGTCHSEGFVASNFLNISIDATIRMRAADLAKLRDVRDFIEIPLVFTLGSATYKRMRFTLPKVRFPIPTIDIPDEGSVKVPFTGGRAYDSAPLANDALELKLY